jgi:hypothetical protein
MFLLLLTLKTGLMVMALNKMLVKLISHHIKYISSICSCWVAYKELTEHEKTSTITLIIRMERVRVPCYYCRSLSGCMVTAET